MAELKKRVLKLSTGRQVKLYGTSISISEALEIGEGYAPNLLALNTESNSDKSASLHVHNPNHFTAEELMELADYMMQLWLQLKMNIRKYGMENPRLFVKKSGR
jgi:hypothetical protein